MNKKAVSWLYGELPELVDKGVLPPEAAEKLKEYYGPMPSGLGRWTLLMVFSLMGSVLLGLGVILIVGHNWDRFDHLTRLLISLGLLLAAQAVAAYALWRKNDSGPWLEGTSVFLMLSVGASIALVGQTYHLVDDFKNFVLVWMVLSLPLVYLMNSKSVAGIYLIGIIVWLASVQQLGQIKYAAWFLLALVLPYYWRMIKTERYANSTVVISWLLILCFYGCFGMTWDKELGELLFALLFSITYFVGMLWFSDAEKTWQNPFQVIGLVGNVGMAYFLSFRMIWVGKDKLLSTVSSGEYFVVFGLVILAAGLCLLLNNRGMSLPSLIGGVPIVVVIAGYLLQSANNSGMYAATLISFYLLALCIGIVWKGVKETRLGVLNMGMLMLAALILLRFFDSNYSFIVRGLVFILLGVGFLAVNVIMARRKGGETK